LEHGLGYCKHHGLLNGEDADVVELQLKKGRARHLIDAAQQIHDWLDRKPGKTRFFWLSESIGQLKLQDSALIDAIASLGGLIAPLNYDDFFADFTGRPALHWKQQPEIDGHIERHSIDFIFHMHGHWRTPESIVLDWRSYYEIAASKRMQDLMHRFARWGTMLFVGCSGTFSDPNFLTLLEWGNEALKESTKRHFVLCRLDEEERLHRDLQRWAMLEPLVYGTSYENLPTFIAGLARDSGRTTGGGNPPLLYNTSSLSGVQTAGDILRGIQ
jgi:hypothetical protein